MCLMVLKDVAGASNDQAVSKAVGCATEWFLYIGVKL